MQECIPEAERKYNISLSRSTAYRAAQTPGEGPRTAGRKTIVPTEVEEKLATFVCAIRELHYPIFKEGVISYLNELLPVGMKEKFKEKQATHTWYYRWLDRYANRVGNANARPMEVDRARWMTAGNFKTFYDQQAEIAIRHGFAFANPNFDPDTPLSEPILWHPHKLSRIISFDETKAQLGTCESTKGAHCKTLTSKCKVGGDKGDILSQKSGGEATIIGGSRGDGASLPAHVIFKSEAGCQLGWLENGPVSTILDYSKDPPCPYKATYTFNGSGGMLHQGCGVAYLKSTILPLYHGEHAVTPANPIMVNCDGHGSHMTLELIEYCRNTGIILMLRPPYTTSRSQGEDAVNYGQFKSKFLKKRREVFTAARLSGKSGLTLADFGKCVKEPWETAFSEEQCRKAWKVTGLVPFTRCVYWELRAEEKARSNALQGVGMDASNMRFEGMVASLFKPKATEEDVAETEEEREARRTRMTASMVWDKGAITEDEAYILVKEHNEKKKREEVYGRRGSG